VADAWSIAAGKSSSHRIVNISRFMGCPFLKGFRQLKAGRPIATL
jgi:hypothetical protein